MVGALMTKTSNKATCSTPTTAVAKETNLAPPIKPGKECEADSPASSAYSVVTSSMGVNRDDLEKMMLQQDQKFSGMISQVMAHLMSMTSQQVDPRPLWHDMAAGEDNGSQVMEVEPLLDLVDLTGK